MIWHFLCLILCNAIIKNALFLPKKKSDDFIDIFKGLAYPLILNFFSWNTIASSPLSIFSSISGGFSSSSIINYSFNIAASTLVNGFAKFKHNSNMTFINFIKSCNLCKILSFYFAAMLHWLVLIYNIWLSEQSLVNTWFSYAISILWGLQKHRLHYCKP